jgi:hypothetical protein
MATAPEAEAEQTANLPAKIPLAADDRGILPVIPRDTEEAARYAQGLIAAGIVPDSYREGGKKDGAPNKALILTGILKALEVGLPPQTGLGTIMPVNGRFTVWGDGAIALIQQHRVIAKHIVQRVGTSFPPDTDLAGWPDDFGYAVSYWRVGQEEPYVGRFTVKDAKRAGLWMNSYKKPWLLYPERMLFNRARAFALRDGFADCLMGLGIREEIEDIAPPIEDGGALGADNSALDDEPVADEPQAAAAEA